MDKQYRPNALQ